MENIKISKSISITYDDANWIKENEYPISQINQKLILAKRNGQNDKTIAELEKEVQNEE